MPLSRSAELPPYFDYITNKALVPLTAAPSPAILGLATGNFAWVEIPTFQRGISWALEQVDDLLSSSSVLLGSIILGQFPRGGRFNDIPAGHQNYVVLVDGLQRFAVGTIILNALHPLVLDTNAALPGEVPYFAALSGRVLGLAPIYQHNAREFRSHPRKAIADQYSSLEQEVTRYIKRELQEGRAAQLAEKVSSTFLNKQVAIDTYFNFAGVLELMNTFLGLNTVRVDLGQVDLLRASLVEKASQVPWASQDVEDMENDFTATFVYNNTPDPELLPLVGVILESLGSPMSATRVFPTWGPTFSKVEVDYFLDFVRRFKQCDNLNPYFDEIRDCGSIPFASLIVYYYMTVKQNGAPEPSFLTGGANEDQDLHQFLLSTYRVLLDGRIGRTRSFTAQLLSGAISSLSNAAEQISQTFLRRGLATAVDQDWLRTALNKADQKLARRIFNAMVLPERAAGWGVGPFNRLDYGRQAQQYAIDHLIPESMRRPNAPGAAEINTLRNFAPLQTNQNRIASATSCSQKLIAGGIYDMAIRNHVDPHPYWNWLVGTQGPVVAADLDAQRFLEPNQNPAIGDERINFIMQSLMARI